MPSGTSVFEETLREHGAAKAKELVWTSASLYGLKQAGRLWSQMLHTLLVKAGFQCCYSDICFY